MSEVNSREGKSYKSKKSNTNNPQSAGKHSAKIWLWIVIAVIILGGVAMAPMVLYKAKQDVTFYIPKNASIDNVKDTLYKYFSPTYADNVMTLMKVRNVDFSKRHGAYLIKKGSSPLSTMRQLVYLSQTPRKLVINHFRDINTLADAIAKKFDFSKEEFVKVATDPKTLEPYGLTPDQALSLFLEDTYEAYWSSTPKDLIDKIGENYKDFWNPKNTQEAEDIRLSPAQLMIIASITDEESNKVDEKGRIGMLYINRLKIGMRLQADPTVRFAVGNFSIHRITNEHLKTESPYNTYRVDGLPPGPIRTTSKQTLQEILDTPPTEDLYMCAREDFSGYHNFAKTYEEHMVNALKYQHELDRRGIK